MTTAVIVTTGNVPAHIRGEGPHGQVVVNEEVPLGCTRTYYAHAGCAITVTEVHPKTEEKLQAQVLSQPEAPAS